MFPIQILSFNLFEELLKAFFLGYVSAAQPPKSMILSCLVVLSVIYTNLNNNWIRHNTHYPFHYLKVCYLLVALNDPRAITNLWNKIPFLNWNPCPNVTVMFDGLILKGTATKASLRTYRILKLQTTLPCLEKKTHFN